MTTARAKQTEQLMFLTAEYAKGHCDCRMINQTFPRTRIRSSMMKLGAGRAGCGHAARRLQFAVVADAPTCRLLNKPFSGSYDDTAIYSTDLSSRPTCSG